MGWLSPNHEYLKGLRDGMLIASKEIDKCGGINDMNLKHLNTEIAKKMIFIGNIIEAVTKIG